MIAVAVLLCNLSTESCQLVSIGNQRHKLFCLGLVHFSYGLQYHRPHHYSFIDIIVNRHAFHEISQTNAPTWDATKHGSFADDSSVNPPTRKKTCPLSSETGMQSLRQKNRSEHSFLSSARHFCPRQHSPTWTVSRRSIRRGRRNRGLFQKRLDILYGTPRWE